MPHGSHHQCKMPYGKLALAGGRAGFLTWYCLHFCTPHLSQEQHRAATAYQQLIKVSPWERGRGRQGGALAKSLQNNYQPRFLQSKEMTPFSSGNHFIPEGSSKRNSQHTQTGRHLLPTPQAPALLFTAETRLPRGGTRVWPAIATAIRQKYKQSCMVFSSSQ